MSKNTIFKIIFIVAILGFFLPFAKLSCGGYSEIINGHNLILGKTYQAGMGMEATKISPQILIIVPFLISILGLYFVFKNKEPKHFYMISSGIGCLFLFIFRVIAPEFIKNKYGDSYGMIKFEFLSGWYFAFLSLLIICVADYMFEKNQNQDLLSNVNETDFTKKTKNILANIENNIGTATKSISQQFNSLTTNPSKNQFISTVVWESSNKIMNEELSKTAMDLTCEALSYRWESLDETSFKESKDPDNIEGVFGDKRKDLHSSPKGIIYRKVLVYSINNEPINNSSIQYFQDYYQRSAFKLLVMKGRN